EAATNAISSPLLEDISVEGATGIIINITGGSNLKIHEVNEATSLIMEAAHEDAEIIFGTVIDEALKDQGKVTGIATGLGGENAFQPMARPEAPVMVQVPASAPISAAAPVPQQQPAAVQPPPPPVEAAPAHAEPAVASQSPMQPQAPAPQAFSG